jgi:hypothetical protein
VDDGFLESLLVAVAAIVGEMAAPGSAAAASGPSPFAASLGRLSDKPVTLGPDEHQGIGAIRDADPNFELGAFLVRVGEMFSAYHEALDLGQPATIRRFVDEHTYMQLAPAAEKAGRRPEGPRALRIHAIRPITAKHDDGLDLVRVFITAEQPGTEELLCEYWELVRKRGVQTKPGLSITKCPNCGGPVDGLDPTRCAYCDTRLADPALDWVVRKITAQ